MTGSGDPLAALCGRFGLPTDAAWRLGALLEALVSDPLAPTAIQDRARAVDDHLADALVALELDEVRRARALADLGSGAGVPGLPLAIALPQARVTLIESAARRCAFLSRAAERCGLDNVTVLHARAEEAGRQDRETYDVVTARALATLPVVAEYAAPLLVVGGTLVAWRGQRDPQAEHEVGLAGAELGLAIGPVRRVLPYPRARDRHLHLLPKVAATPARFPRRPGMALKRPLGR